MDWYDILTGFSIILIAIILIKNAKEKDVGESDLTKQILIKGYFNYIIAPFLIMCGLFLIFRGIFNF